MLPADAVVDGATFTGTFWLVTGLITTVEDCPEPVSPTASETETLNMQLDVVPEAVDAYENDPTLPGFTKFGHAAAPQA
jgi:hypothetical protein